MTALSAPRSTPRLGDGVLPTVLSVPVKAATKVQQGGIVVLNAGYAAPATEATGLIAIGVADLEADNTGGSAGAISARVRSGVFKFGNSASTDLIAQAQVGSDCYLVDDQTVAKTSNSSARSRAGKVVAIDADGSVWVQLALGV